LPDLNEENVEIIEDDDQESPSEEPIEPSHYRNRLGQLIETRKISKEYSKTRENG
jgi:hypothetical protein